MPVCVLPCLCVCVFMFVWVPTYLSLLGSGCGRVCVSVGLCSYYVWVCVIVSYWVCERLCVCVSVWDFVCVLCAWLCVCGCVWVCLFVYVCVGVCEHVSLCVFICLGVCPCTGSIILARWTKKATWKKPKFFCKNPQGSRFLSAISVSHALQTSLGSCLTKAIQTFAIQKGIFWLALSVEKSRHW